MMTINMTLITTTNMDLITTMDSGRTTTISDRMTIPLVHLALTIIHSVHSDLMTIPFIDECDKIKIWRHNGFYQYTIRHFTDFLIYVIHNLRFLKTANIIYNKFLDRNNSSLASSSRDCVCTAYLLSV